MVGHPKFNLNDKVTFTIQGKQYIGTVYIIDRYGTFSNPSDVSYDVLVKEEDGTEYLVKHVTERLVEAYAE